VAKKTNLLLQYTRCIPKRVTSWWCTSPRHSAKATDVGNLAIFIVDTKWHLMRPLVDSNTVYNKPLQCWHNLGHRKAQ